MDSREVATVVLSGAVLVLGIMVLPVITAITRVVAGGGRLWLWWRQRGR